MNDHPVLRLLRPVSRRHRFQKAALSLAATWALGALAAAVLLYAARALHLNGTLTALFLGFLVVLTGFILALRTFLKPSDPREAARRIEARHPDLNGLLITAAEQQPGPTGSFNFLQCRLLDQALEHGRRHDWLQAQPLSRCFASLLLALPAFVALVFILSLIAKLPASTRPDSASSPMAARVITGIEVEPGDTSLERGSSLVVLARFPKAPRGAELVITSSNQAPQRIPLVRNLADPMFGGAFPDVAASFTYRVESDAGSSREFKVEVFEFPRLERSIVDITYPAYTGREPKHIDDTRRVTAVEGSSLNLALQLNKPVTQATLVPRSPALTPLSLVTASNLPVATLSAHPLLTNATYDLVLIDADGRSNQTRSQFVFEVPPNRVPELKLALPRGDIQPSPLEEIRFEGTVWDDFGMSAFGIGIIRVGSEPDIVELGREVPGNKRLPFEHPLHLEALAAQPDEVFGWFVWADDTGPDGTSRRTTSDIFFAEVRRFEEIFREGEGSSGEEGGESQSGQQQGNAASKLAQLQKQIITATWKLQSRRPSGTNAPRNTRVTSPQRLRPAPLTFSPFFAQPAPPRRLQSERPGNSPGAIPTRSSGSYEQDLQVIRDAAQQALDQARESMEEQSNPAQQALWSTAIAQMERSIELLAKASSSPAVLKEAIAAQQAAYQAILKLQSRETEVSRSRSQSQSQSQSQNQRNQRQMDELDLTQTENRYETQSQARAPVDDERREQLQAVNRLQELAQRQEEVNQQLKELQTALQAADEKQREEIQRQLQKLQEEQRQNLADADELQQRMERGENQSRMSEERERLEEARQQMERAAEATQQGQVSQALAAGTRAQTQLNELREDLRRQSADQLKDSARELREDARELARNQEEIRRQLDARPDPKALRSLTDDGSREALFQKLADQQSALTNIVQRATQLSEQAEDSEPLLSRQLYDSLRQFSQEDLGNLKKTREELIEEGQMNNSLYRSLTDANESGAKTLEATRQLLQQGLQNPARQAEQRARASIDSLRQGIDKAANSVLGDDTEALRLAQQELENAARALESERPGQEEGQEEGQGQAQESGTRGTGGTGGTNEMASSASQPGQPGQPGSSGSQQSQPSPGSPGSQQPSPSDPLNLASRPLPGSQGSEGSPQSGQGSPITGSGFAEWSDRLRDAETLIDSPTLRAGVSNARDQARRLRIDYRNARKKPDWATIELEILKPLVETRDLIREELARRAADNPLVPLDRDPVPGRYSEMVRRYYEQLGRDQ